MVNIMPCNTGTMPELDKVDLIYRCGVIQRGIEPRSLRWSVGDPNFPPDFDWDIIWWQKPKPSVVSADHSHQVVSAKDLARYLAGFDKAMQQVLDLDERPDGDFARVA